jgi:uncharacterized protein YaiI (UPF0178 family)
MDIYIDADACPVKDEVYKVAARHGLKTYVVSNTPIMIPRSPLIARVVVAAGPDMADHWIAEHIAAGDVAITSDIPLADRVLKAGAQAVAPTGKPFDNNSIGSAMAQRALMEQLRATGAVVGGPRPFGRAERSRFLQALETIIQRQRRPRA